MTSIEWVKNADGSQGLTWNPIRGCTRVSPGCGGPGPHGGCYAEGIAARFSGPGQPYEGLATRQGGKPRWTGKLAFVESALTAPLQRRKPTTWFVNSMSDLFHEKVPDEWIDRVFAVMALAPRHTFQVLTKRAARMRSYLTDSGLLMRLRMAVCRQDIVLGAEWASDVHFGAADGLPLPNVWLGVSAEDQRRADERIPDLLATPAALRFVSAEPLLGPIDFTEIEEGCTRRDIPREYWEAAGDTEEEPPGATTDALSGREYQHHGHWSGDCARLDWVIVGGESGPNARPMHPAWARQIRDACAAAGVAFHYKQAGAWAALEADGGEWPADAGSLIRLNGDGTRGPYGWPMQRVGKKAAGRLLDGVEHNGMPEVRHG